MISLIEESNFWKILLISTVNSAITLSEITGTSVLMMAHGGLIQILILIKVSWPSTQDNIAIRLLFRISTSHWFEQYPHYEQYPQITISTVPQKSKGTSYCSSNSYSNHDKQQSWQITVAVRKKRISPKWKQNSSVFSVASDAPFSLYKGAHSSVFSRL